MSKPLLQSHDGIPLEIPLGVVLIASNGFAREFDPQSLQDPAQQGGAAAMHAHHQQKRRPGHKKGCRMELTLTRMALWLSARPEQLGWPWRRLRLPHFLGLGTQKGGTTSLQKLLEQHPGVYLPPCKEVHYFSLHAEEPARWYAEHYRDARRGQRRGDITPFYLFHPDVPARIRALLPRARMIVLLRDPVERALSQVFHARRHGFETLEVADALAAEPERLAIRQRLQLPEAQLCGAQPLSGATGSL